MYQSLDSRKENEFIFFEEGGGVRVGVIGAKGVAMFRGTVQDIINQLEIKYGIPKEKILLGNCAEPPDAKECLLYGHIVGMGEYSATTVWIRWYKESGGEWVNDSDYIPKSANDVSWK